MTVVSEGTGDEARPAVALDGGPPRLTVVIGCLNQSGPLTVALESLAEQEFRSFDCVVVDDGSRPEEAAALRALAAARPWVRLLRHEVNRGLAAALNRGWRATPAPLIARMDADDLCRPARLARQVAALDADPAIDVLGTAVELVDADGRSLGFDRPATEDAEIRRHLLRRLAFYHPSVVMRRRFLERTGGYDEAFRHGAQDAELWFRGAAGHRYANLSEPLLRYRVPGRVTWRRTWASVGATLVGGRHLGRPWMARWCALLHVLTAMRRHLFGWWGGGR